MLFRRIFFITATATLLLTIPFTRASAQSSEIPKIEIGAQFSLLRISDLDTNNPGVGGRITWNVTRTIGVEGEVNLFPERSNAQFDLRQSRKIQGQFGLKTGFRSDRFGVFGKVRPGFVHFDRILLSNCPPGNVCPAVFRIGSETKFSFDVGGVLEFYPSRHTMLRFDLGNTIISFSERNLPQGTKNNLQFSTGFGFRF
jgi:hypothetical protein